jgi:hypothetical protein
LQATWTEITDPARVAAAYEQRKPEVQAEKSRKKLAFIEEQRAKAKAKAA